jgi:hypothetical protein
MLDHIVIEVLSHLITSVAMELLHYLFRIHGLM